MNTKGAYMGGPLYAKAVMALMARSLSSIEIQELTEFHHGTAWRFIRYLRQVSSPDGTRKPCMFIERWSWSGTHRIAHYRLGYATQDAPPPVMSEEERKERKRKRNRESYLRAKERKLKSTTTEEIT